MMPTIEIMTVVVAALTIYLCHDEYKNGKMSSKNFKIVAICEGFAILGMIFLIISRQSTSSLQNRKYPPGHHGREGFVRLGDYPSISIFSPDLSSTVKWSSQTMIRSSQRFTSASSKVPRCAGCCLIKSCSSLMRAICASLAAVSTVHFSRCSRSLKISSAISSQASLLLDSFCLPDRIFISEMIIGEMVKVVKRVTDQLQIKLLWCWLMQLINLCCCKQLHLVAYIK